MWDRCKQYFTGGVVGAIIAFLVAFSIAKHMLHIPQAIVSTPEKTVVVKLVTKIDTVWKKQRIVEYKLVEHPSIIKTDSVFLPGTHDVAMIPGFKNTYEDSTKFAHDSLTVSYKANVVGKLNNITLGYKDYRAQKTILRTDSIFTTTTLTKYPAGIFLGIDAGYKQLSPSIEYVKDKNSFGINYNIITQIPGVSYKRRIF